MKKVILDIIITLIHITVLAWPTKNIWNMGVVKALSIAQPITYTESMDLVALIFIVCIINGLNKDIFTGNLK